MSVFEGVIGDLRGRDALGAAEHGGRELVRESRSGAVWARDGYEEALDMAVYLRGLVEWAEAVERELGAVVDVLPPGPLSWRLQALLRPRDEVRGMRTEGRSTLGGGS